MESTGARPRSEISAVINATADGGTVAIRFPLRLLKLPTKTRDVRFDAKVIAFAADSADGAAGGLGMRAHLFTAAAPQGQTFDMTRVRIPPAG